MGEDHAAVQDTRLRLTRMMRTGKSVCRGVALITAMLVVALVAVIAVQMATSQWIEIRRTGNVLDADRVDLVAGGVEAWAIGQLTIDGANGTTDHLNEDWSKPLPPTKIDGGEVTGSIQDVQARFNLNNLVSGDKLSSVDARRFSRLLDHLRIDTGLIQAIADWIDADSQPRFPNGAEDEVYVRKTPAYRAANRPLTDISELLLIEGMTREIYERLSPHVCALPDYTDINLNTAGVTLLRSLSDKLKQSEADLLTRARLEAPFEGIEDFMHHPVLNGLTVESAGLGVSSNYFLVNARAAIGRSRVRVSSVLARLDRSKVNVLSRSRRTW